MFMSLPALKISLVSYKADRTCTVIKIVQVQYSTLYFPVQGTVVQGLLRLCTEYNWSHSTTSTEMCYDLLYP